MLKYKINRIKKRLIKDDDIEEGLNKPNETVLVKELTKAINKNKTKPIDTSSLLKK